MFYFLSGKRLDKNESKNLKNAKKKACMVWSYTNQTDFFSSFFFPILKLSVCLMDVVSPRDLNGPWLGH